MLVLGLKPKTVKNGKRGKFIVIESNDESMKDDVVDELSKRLHNCNIFIKRMKTTNEVVGHLERIAINQFGRDLEWTTSFLIAEAALLETISHFNEFGLGKVVRSGKNVLIDQYDSTLYVNIVPRDRALNVLFHTVNNKVTSMLYPSIRIFISSPVVGEKKYSSRNVDLKRVSLHAKIKNDGENVEIVDASDKSLNDLCVQVEKIIRDHISA